MWGEEVREKIKKIEIIINTIEWCAKKKGIGTPT